MAKKCAVRQAIEKALNYEFNNCWIDPTSPKKNKFRMKMGPIKAGTDLYEWDMEKLENLPHLLKWSYLTKSYGLYICFHFDCKPSEIKSIK